MLFDALVEHCDAMLAELPGGPELDECPFIPPARLPGSVARTRGRDPLAGRHNVGHNNSGEGTWIIGPELFDSFDAAGGA